MEFYDQLLDAISRDDPQAIGRISVDDLNVLLSQLPPGTCFPPLHFAASEIATKCLKYLLKHVPKINVNLGYTMCACHPLSTPFLSAMHYIFTPEEYATDEQIQFARILARDHRTDVNMNVLATVDGEVWPIVHVIQRKTEREMLPNNALLLDVLSNPNLDVNYPAVQGGNLRLPIFLHSIVKKKKAEFLACLKHPKIDLTQCCADGNNALHYAAGTVWKFAVVKLLDAMSPDDLHKVNNDGQSPLEVVQVEHRNTLEHFDVLHLILSCPRFVVGDTLLGSMMVKAVRYYDEDDMKPFELFVTFIDSILAHPTFNMAAVVKTMSSPGKAHVLIPLLEWPDELMMIKFIEHKGMTDEVLLASVDGHNPHSLAFTLFHKVLELPYALHVVNQMVKIQLSHHVGATNLETAVHRVVKMDRDDILRVFVETIAVDALKKPSMESIDMKLFAQRWKAKKCLKVITEFERVWQKKTTRTEYGHVFDCC